MTPADLFAGFPDSRAVYDAVARAVADLGEATVRVTKSQVAFRRRRGFAYVWRPGQYVRSEVPAVLSIATPYAIDSDRFKSVVPVSARLWMHHLEVTRPEEIDAEVLDWLAAAYDGAG